MIQKNIRKTILAPALLLLLLAGCRKDLDQKPQTALTDAAFWKTTSDLNQACTYLYTFLGGFSGSDPSGNPLPYLDDYSDIAFAGTTANSVSNGSRSAPGSSNDWTNNYKLIRACNNIIQKSASITGDAALIRKYVGEARFFRAFGYFELVKRFGDVPYLNRTVAMEDTTLYPSRSPRQMVIDSAYADFDYAAANCPVASAQDAKEYGRITRSAALAYKSRVALFEGTWDKYRSISTATRNLQTSLDASSTVITEGKHSLYYAAGADAANSYNYEFLYSGGAAGNPIQLANGGQVNYNYASNKENIMVRLYGASLTNIISAHSFERVLEQSTIVATKNFMDNYLYKDGLPQAKSPWDSTNMQTSSLTDFQNRDPRMAMTIWNKTQPFPTQGPNYNPGIIYKIRKFFSYSDWNLQTCFVNYNVVRYAEVLLNYAEAKYEINGSLNDADLNLTINALRNRATNSDATKLALLTNSFASANGLNILTEIRRERTIELAFEGFRYWDLIRWKTAETVLPVDILGRKFFASENPAGTNPILVNGYVRLEPAANRKFNPARDYLWPIPTSEIALNPNLGGVNNPNW